MVVVEGVVPPGFQNADQFRLSTACLAASREGAPTARASRMASSRVQYRGSFEVELRRLGD